MSRFKAAAILVTVFAAVIFVIFGKNEKNTNKSQMDNFAINAQVEPVVRSVLPTNEPVMPKGFNKNNFWRDPFAAPIEVAGVIKTPDLLQQKPPDVSGGGFNLLDAGNPSLVGIMSSGSRKTAIIRHRDENRIYEEGDWVGSYELVQIAEKMIVLKSKERELIIQLL